MRPSFPCYQTSAHTSPQPPPEGGFDTCGVPCIQTAMQAACCGFSFNPCPSSARASGLRPPAPAHCQPRACALIRRTTHTPPAIGMYKYTPPAIGAGLRAVSVWTHLAALLSLSQTPLGLLIF